jgi:hypothetical protein
MARELVIQIRIEGQSEAKAGLQALDTQMAAGDKTAGTFSKSTEDLANTTKKLGGAASDQALSVGKLVASLVTAQVVLGTLRQAGDLFADFLKDSVRQYAEAEGAQIKLTAALKAAGIASPLVRDRFLEMGEAFMQTTRYTHEMINEGQALLVQVGGAMPSQMEKATQAAVDLAAGLGIDLNSAFLLVAKAMAGHEMGLQRYGVSISDAAIAAHGADAIFEALETRFGGQAQAQVESLSGRLERLKNLWGELKEQLGEVIVKQPLVEAGMRRLEDSARGAGENTGGVAAGIGAMAHAIDMALFNGFLAFLSSYVGDLNEIDRITRAAPKSPWEAILANQSGLAALPPIMAAMNAETERIARAQEAARLAAEAHAKAIQALTDKFIGTGLTQQLNDTVEAFGKLTPAELANRDVAERVVEQYGKLREHLSAQALPAGLEDYYQKNLKVISSTEALVTRLQGLNLTEIPTLTSGAEGLTNMLAGLTANGLLPATSGIEGMLEKSRDQTEATKKVREAMGDLAVTLPTATGLTREQKDAIFEVDDKTKTWTGSLGFLNQSLSQLAQTGGPLAGTARELATLVGAMDVGAKAGTAIEKGWTALEKGGKGAAAGAMELAAGVAAASAAMETGVTATEDWKGALEGASAGASIGTQILPGYGTAIGAIIGAIYGMIKAEDNHTTAIILESQKISELKTKYLDAAGGYLALYDRVQLLGPAGLQALQGILSATTVKTTQDAIDQLTAALKGLEDQQKAANNAVASFLTVITGWTKPLNDAQKNVEDLEKQYADLAATADPDPLKLAELAAKLLMARTEVGSLAGDVKTHFGHMTDYALASFAAIYKTTGSFTLALQATLPILDQMAVAHDTLGLRGSAAFEELYHISEVTRQNKDALASVDALTAGMGFLEAAGVMTDTLILDFGKDLKDTFDKGVTGSTTQKDMLIAMQPYWQKLWELTDTYHVKVDDATQAVIDQGIQWGLIGPDIKSKEDPILSVMQEMRDTIRELADFMETVWAPKAKDAWGVATGAAEDYARAIRNIPEPPAGGTGVGSAGGSGGTGGGGKPGQPAMLAEGWGSGGKEDWDALFKIAVSGIDQYTKTIADLSTQLRFAQITGKGFDIGKLQAQIESAASSLEYWKQTYVALMTARNQTPGYGEPIPGLIDPTTGLPIEGGAQPPEPILNDPEALRKKLGQLQDELTRTNAMLAGVQQQIAALDATGQASDELNKQYLYWVAQRDQIQKAIAALPKLHEGGIAQWLGGARVLPFVPRYHDGAEVPAVLEVGEGVLSRTDMSALGGARGFAALRAALRSSGQTFGGGGATVIQIGDIVVQGNVDNELTARRVADDVADRILRRLQTQKRVAYR